MVSAIVNKYEPDYVSPPGETLLETIESLGMTQIQLAERTGRPPKTISEIVKGKAAITPDTALQLEKVLGVPATFWTNREMRYRESLARQKEQERLSYQIDWLKSFPVAEMCKKKWIPCFKDKMQQLHAVLRYFGVASPEAWNDVQNSLQADFRQSKAFETKRGAISAWLRKGEIDAKTIDCKTYNRSAFFSALQQARNLTTESPSVFQPKLTELFASVGVAVVFVPELRGTRVSGATRWLDSNKALIQLSLRYKTNDHLWFTFFHEAGHIYIHGKRDAFIESYQASECAKESEANEFSADFLIPRAEYERFIALGSFDKSSVISFAKEIGIAAGIVVGRLQYDKLLPHNQLNDLKQYYQWNEEH